MFVQSGLTFVGIFKLLIVLQYNLKSFDRISSVEKETWFLMRVTFISTFAHINNKLCYCVFTCIVK